MIEFNKMVWSDEGLKEEFSKSGFSTFDDIWAFNEDDFDVEEQRQHKSRWSGKISRRTVKLTLNGNNYFLKRISDGSYSCIIDEYKALFTIPQFGLTAAEFACYSFDSTQKAGFLLFKELNGYFSLNSLKRAECSDDINKLFTQKKDQFYLRIKTIFNKFQASDYYYRDWLAKHLFINFDNDNIALIDLERLCNKSDKSLFFRLFLSSRARRKEVSTLIKALDVEDSFLDEDIK